MRDRKDIIEEFGIGGGCGIMEGERHDGCRMGGH